MKKLEYDLYYVKNHTLFLDLLILLETVRVVLLGRRARARPAGRALTQRGRCRVRRARRESGRSATASRASSIARSIVRITQRRQLTNCPCTTRCRDRKRPCDRRTLELRRRRRRLSSRSRCGSALGWRSSPRAALLLAATVVTAVWARQRRRVSPGGAATGIGLASTSADAFRYAALVPVSRRAAARANTRGETATAPRTSRSAVAGRAGGGALVASMILPAS